MNTVKLTCKQEIRIEIEYWEREIGKRTMIGGESPSCIWEQKTIADLRAKVKRLQKEYDSLAQ